MLSAFLRGLALGASLIIAIGAQNAFVLRQGLKRRFPGVVASVCTFCDIGLIGLGAAGFGTMIARVPLLAHGASLVGAVFLFVYGARAFQSARRPAAREGAQVLSCIDWVA